MPRRVKLRITAFLVLAGLLQLSPFAVQVLGARNPPLLMGWRMYATTGADICAVYYESRMPDGTIRRIELDELGPWNRRIVRVKDAETLGRARCGSLGADGDLRLFARCGHARRGWITRASGEANLCGSIP